jgi:hypothetical protein
VERALDAPAPAGRDGAVALTPFILRRRAPPRARRSRLPLATPSQVGSVAPAGHLGKEPDHDATDAPARDPGGRRRRRRGPRPAPPRRTGRSGPCAWSCRSRPGGSLDALSRLFGRHLGELGQPWLVENQGAAGGNPAFEAVARSRPDGHTLLWGWDSLAINPALYARVGYDPLRDFTPVVQVVRAAQLLVVRPDLPARTLAEFLDLARRRALSVASPGNGSIGHLAAELLRARTGASGRTCPTAAAGRP